MGRNSSFLVRSTHVYRDFDTAVVNRQIFDGRDILGICECSNLGTFFHDERF